MALDPSNPAHRHFCPSGGYGAFARHEAVEITRAELSHAAVCYALAFVAPAGAPQLVALLGLPGSGNLYLDGADRWLTDYVPAEIRRFPFSLGDGRLRVDPAGGALAEPDAAPEGHPLFRDDASPTDHLGRIERFLDLHAQDQVATRSAVAEIAALGLLEPWCLSVRVDGTNRALDGYQRVSADALAGLGDREVGRLWRSGAAWIAHAQLLSMRNIASLGKLWAASRHGAAAGALEMPDPDDCFDFVAVPRTGAPAA